MQKIKILLNNKNCLYIYKKQKYDKNNIAFTLINFYIIFVYSNKNCFKLWMRWAYHFCYIIIRTWYGVKIYNRKISFSFLSMAWIKLIQKLNAGNTK